MYKFNPLLAGKLDRVGVEKLGDLDNVSTAGTAEGYVLTYGTTLDTWTPKVAAGGGDMEKSVYVTGSGTVYNASRLGGDTLATVQAHNVDASKITSGTFGIARIPTMDDAHIPDLDTLGYGAAFAVGQIPNLAATKITSGTIGLARIPGTLTGKDADTVDGADAGVVADDIFKIPSGIAQGDVFHVNAGGSVVNLSAGTSGHFLKTLGAGTNPAWASVPGGGDMLKSVYDTTDNSIVDNSERLETNTLATVQAHNVDASKITSGTFNANRIPSLPTTKTTTGTFNLNRIPAVDDVRIPDLETLSYGGAFAGAQIPNLAASKITSGSFNANRIPVLPASRITTGTFNLNRIPAVDDAHIPDLETLSYGAAFATAQIPLIGAYKITSGTLAVARHETLDNLNGTVALSQVPTMDDGHIPDLDTLSYSGAFATAQVPPIGAYKTTTGTFGADRIPILPTDRYGSAVLLTGAQSIGGTKTFTDIPILPASDPTADNEAARKAYVDSVVVTEGTYTTSFTFGSAQAIQDAGTAFTIGGFMTHGYLKEMKFRANYTAGTFSTVSGKVNNAAGILAAGTVIANDGRSGTFLIGDYIESENEIMRISGTVSPSTLIVSRAKKGSGAGFIDDNEDIVRLNSGFTLQLFKNTNKKKYEMPLMLSSLMTAKGVTDASISSGNKRIELSAELKNVDNLDTIRIDDGASSEEALVQNNVGDCVSGTYDYNLYVYDALGSHASSKTVEKVCKYDILANYKSTAGTLYGRVQLMQSYLGSNLSINIDIKGDTF